MKIYVAFIVFGAVFGVSLAASWVKVFEDEFDGTGLPSATDWKYQTGCDGWGNNELECYVASQTKNTRRENGSLIIEVVVEESNGKHYTSARLNSVKHWTFGKFEVRAKLPKGKHLWPAIWMMPQDSVYGGWAASGEIDIMEYRGERTNIILGTIHYGGAWPNNVNSGSGEKTYAGTDFSAGFHTFGLEWSADQMIWSLDGTAYHTENLNRAFYSGKGTNPYTANRQPFDKDFYFILNIAVGGNFFPEATYGTLSVDEAKQWPKRTMEIDFVRVSKYQ